MTADREEIVTTVVAAAGGRLTSRIRLQKAMYLLDRLGLESGFDYEYYHYGPYSRQVENAAQDAEAFGLLKEYTGRRKSDGAPYSIFEATAPINERALGQLQLKKVQELMKSFSATNVTVLELAATVDWLVNVEKRKDWDAEVRKRKGAKASPDRLQTAMRLLKDLGLEPPASAVR
jgi:uncharacterized protein YwgA